MDTKATVVNNADMALQLERLSNRTSLAAMDSLLHALPEEGGSTLASALEAKSVADHMVEALDELSASPLWSLSRRS